MPQESTLPEGEHAAPSVAARQTVGRFLRSARVAMRLSQEQVAALTAKRSWGLSRAAISAIERGRNLPSLDALLAYWTVLQVNPMEVLEKARLARILPNTDQQHQQPADSVSDPREKIRRQAAGELQRARALRRAGALLAAKEAGEASIGHAVEFPDIQAEAYTLLAALHLRIGNAPLASDAATRAVCLSAWCAEEIQGRAWAAQGEVLWRASRHEEALRAWLEARSKVLRSNDHSDLAQTEGNIGCCLAAMGRRVQARAWMRRAVARASRDSLPGIAARWLVELGRIALEDRDLHEATRHALTAISIGGHQAEAITVFRAEWLRHQIVLLEKPGDHDRQRVGRLRRLLPDLEEYREEREVRDFRNSLATDRMAFRFFCRGDRRDTS